jgi:hypothetical protein
MWNRFLKRANEKIIEGLQETIEKI